jgi:adenosylmethionine-8-amino-7-oxononanoate aminotransferase
MEKEETWKQIQMISKIFNEFSHKHQAHKKITNIRSLGCVLAIEINTSEHTHYLNAAAETIANYFIIRHIIVRPLGNVLYLIPPYCSLKHELENVLSVFEDFLNQ